MDEANQTNALRSLVLLDITIGRECGVPGFWSLMKMAETTAVFRPLPLPHPTHPGAKRSMSRDFRREFRRNPGRLHLSQNHVAFTATLKIIFRYCSGDTVVAPTVRPLYRKRKYVSTRERRTRPEMANRLPAFILRYILTDDLTDFLFLRSSFSDCCGRVFVHQKVMLCPKILIPAFRGSVSFSKKQPISLLKTFLPHPN